MDQEHKRCTRGGTTPKKLVPPCTPTHLFTWKESLSRAATPPSFALMVWREAVRAFTSRQASYLSARTLGLRLGITGDSFERAYKAAGGVPLVLLERQVQQHVLGAPVTSQAAWPPPSLDPWYMVKVSDPERWCEVVRNALAPPPDMESVSAPPVHGGRFHDPEKGKRQGRREDGPDTLLVWTPGQPSAAGQQTGGGLPRRFWAVDVESTGSTAEDRLTEVALVLFEDGEPVGVHATLLDPGRPIPNYLERKIGITNAMVQGKPTFAQIARRLIGYLEGSVVVWHSTANFDRRMITQELARCGLRWPSTRREIDTQRLARAKGLPESLAGLCAALSIPLERHHRAADDATACGMALVALMGEDSPHVPQKTGGSRPATFTGYP